MNMPPFPEPPVVELDWNTRGITESSWQDFKSWMRCNSPEYVNLLRMHPDATEEQQLRVFAHQLLLQLARQKNAEVARIQASEVALW